MNYAIAHLIQDFASLTFYPRKPAIKHRLVMIDQGQALLRLGKEEYLLNPQEVCFVPAHALTGLTFLLPASVQDSQHRHLMLEISTRLDLNLPPNAGKVTPSPLLQACLEKLRTLEFNPDSVELQHLYAVIQDEMSHLAPSLSQLPTLNSLDDPNIDAQVQLRQALIAQKSGQKMPKIIQDIYQGDANALTRTCLVYLNQPTLD